MTTQQRNGRKFMEPMTLLTSFAGVITMIMMAAVPWAYDVHARIHVIEQRLHELSDMEVPPLWFVARVDALESRAIERDQKLIDIDKKVDVLINLNEQK